MAASVLLSVGISAVPRSPYAGHARLVCPNQFDERDPVIASTAPARLIAFRSVCSLKRASCPSMMVFLWQMKHRFVTITVS